MSDLFRNHVVGFPTRRLIFWQDVMNATLPCADPENFLRWGGGGGPNSPKGSGGKIQHGKN